MKKIIAGVSLLALGFLLPGAASAAYASIADFQSPELDLRHGKGAFAGWHRLIKHGHFFYFQEAKS